MIKSFENHPDFVNTLMSGYGQVMRTLADAIDADLAISPMVMALQPGVGGLTFVKAMAGALSHKLIDLRCAQLDPNAYELSSKLVEQTLVKVERVPGLTHVTQTLAAAHPTIMLLDEACDADATVIKRVLDQVTRDAKAPVIVVFAVRLDQIDQALDLIAQGLGVEAPLVPLVRLAPGVGGQPRTTSITGWASLEGSKRCERHLSIDMVEPYDHSARVTVIALEDQDDDDLTEALSDRIEGGQVAMRVTIDGHGSMTCSTDDMVQLERPTPAGRADLGATASRSDAHATN